MLVSTGLATIDEIAECVIAQCGATSAPTSADLRFAIESDAYTVAALAERETLTRVSNALEGTWLDQRGAADSVHVACAERLFGAGRLDDCERALARVRWYEPLLRFFARHRDALSDPLRHAVVEGVVVRLERWLARDYHVSVLAELATITRDAWWLERAERLVSTLAASELETNPDREHPLISIARAEAVLGDTERALRRVRELADDERWPGLVAIAELSDASYDSLEQELLDLRARIDLPWWFAVEPLPRLTRVALAAIDRMPARERIHALCSVAPVVAPDHTREVCRRALALLEDTALREDIDAWILLLERVDGCGVGDLLGEASRAKLLEQWRALGEPEDLGHALAPFVPDGAVDAVLEDAMPRLSSTPNWLDREAWLARGMHLVARASSRTRTRWLAAAAAALASWPPDRLDDEALSPFSEPERRQIVLANLAAAQARVAERL